MLVHFVGVSYALLTNELDNISLSRVVTGELQSDERAVHLQFHVSGLTGIAAGRVAIVTVVTIVT